MQDNIPDALITAFERQYDSSWNDPKLRKERLAMRYGWAAAMEAKPCLHQIQEPAPATAMDALREAEAALEVAMARILKADPGHSICVTSEAKALVAVRAALAATPAAAPVVLPEPFLYSFEEQVAPIVGSEQKIARTTYTKFKPSIEHTAYYTEQQVRALLATGGQAQADMPDSFREWFAQNYPADTIIVDPDWHAKSIFRMAQAHARLAAPQAQADARDAEQERWMGIGKAIERACVDLPAGAEINIHLEKDAGTVTLSDCDGDEQENFPTDEGFAGVVNAAIDAAIAAAKGE